EFLVEHLHKATHELLSDLVGVGAAIGDAVDLRVGNGLPPLGIGGQKTSERVPFTGQVPGAARIAQRLQVGCVTCCIWRGVRQRVPLDRAASTQPSMTRPRVCMPFLQAGPDFVVWPIQTAGDGTSTVARVAARIGCRLALPAPRRTLR